jgi:hypothetical protein
MGNVFGRGLLYDVVYVRMVETRYHALPHYIGEVGEVHNHSFFVGGSLKDDGDSVRVAVQGFALPVIPYQIVRRVKSEFFTK